MKIEPINKLGYSGKEDLVTLIIFLSIIVDKTTSKKEKRKLGLGNLDCERQQKLERHADDKLYKENYK